MNFVTELSRARCGAAFVTASIFLPPLLAACGSNSTADAGPTPVGNVVIKDVNNYKATSTLTIPKVQATPATDINICWTGISTDLLCHSVDVASDINSVTFLQLINFAEAKIESALGTGQDFTRSVLNAGTHTVAAGETCAKLSSFSLYGNVGTINPSTNYVAAADKTYMLLFSKGTTIGMGAKTMLFLEPTDGSSTTKVDAQPACGILDFKSDITSPQVLNIPTAGPWVVDWSLLTVDGLGNAVNFSIIDSVEVGYHAGKTVADVQAHFFDLETAATSVYEVKVPKGMTNVDLKSATVIGGTLPDLSKTQGVWALALKCSTCQVPAPVALTILNPS